MDVRVKEMLQELLAESQRKVETLDGILDPSCTLEASELERMMSLRSELVSGLRKILKISGFNASKLAPMLGMSDQKIYRWLQHPPNRGYVCPRPTISDLSRLREVVLLESKTPMAMSDPIRFLEIVTKAAMIPLSHETMKSLLDDHQRFNNT